MSSTTNFKHADVLEAALLAMLACISLLASRNSWQLVPEVLQPSASACSALALGSCAGRSQRSEVEGVAVAMMQQVLHSKTGLI